MKTSTLEVCFIKASRLREAETVVFEGVLFGDKPRFHSICKFREQVIIRIQIGLIRVALRMALRGFSGASKQQTKCLGAISRMRPRVTCAGYLA